MSPKQRVRVIYADEWIVALNKPPGLSLATPHSDPQAAVSRLVEATRSNEIEEYQLDPLGLRLVHRLDVGTSGVVLLARDAETHSWLVHLFTQRAVEKTYLALVWGHPRPKEGVFDGSIGPDRGDRRRMRIDPKGSWARTSYRTVGTAPHVSLLELRPETGRTHQLRVHLAHAGHWIVGDDLYAGARHHGVRDSGLRSALAPSHLLLHAWRLRLPAGNHPGPTQFEAALPSAFAASLGVLGLTIPA
jgi:23S rRNA pseudouridine1911/1915/1917 synthase